MSVLTLLLGWWWMSPADSADLIQAGPMLGYAEKNEVVVWLQTSEEATVHVRYWKKGQSGMSWMTRPVRTEASQDHIAHIRVGNLTHGTTYEYEIWINYRQVRFEWPLAFRTQPLWEFRTDPPDFTAAVGSCAFINEDSVDRPGEPYGGHYGIFRALAEVNPDLMLWVGDNIYLREVDWNSWSGILHRHRHTRSLRELQPLLSNTNHYAVWDDHDFGSNNSDRGFAHKTKTLEAFKLYWPNPNFGLPDAPGVFFKFRWADVDFFMLDDRYHRSPNAEKDTPSKTMLGKVQLAWLKDALLYSRAPFKVIVCGNQVLNTLARYESFSQYSYEREDLLEFIRQYKIGGILFVSGDRHHTELLKLETKGFYPLYDFTSSPLTSGTHKPGDEVNNPMRVPGTAIFDKRNFGLMRFSGKYKARQVTLETYDETGQLLWKHTIHERELKTADDKSDRRD